AARQLFAKAIELDPAYARAHAGLADAEAFLLVVSDPSASYERVLASSARALELEPGLADARVARPGTFHDRTVCGGGGGIRARDRARRRQLRGALLLWPELLHPGPIRQGRGSVPAGGLARSRRLPDLGVPADDPRLAGPGRGRGRGGPAGGAACREGD